MQMAISYCAVIFASVLLTTVSSFTVTDVDPALPTQKFLDDNTLLRILPNTEEEIIRCPQYTYLDKSTLICQFNSSYPSLTIPQIEICPGGKFGDFVYPEDCRSFASCGSAGIFRVPCPANLLFNEAKDYCDWPREAGCCEFVEKNSSRLMANSESPDI